MRKIDVKNYASFQFECDAFKLVGSFETCKQQFTDWSGRAVFYGIKKDGTKAIIDSKN